MNPQQVFRVALMASLFLIATPLAGAGAEPCVGYAALTQGTRFQLTTYDEGDETNILSTSDHEVISSRSDGATLHVHTTDANGKTTVDSDYDIDCTSAGIVMDTKTLLSKEMSAKITDPDVRADVTGNNLEIPSQLSVGQSLPDSKIHIVVSAGKVKLTMSVDVHDRKVIGQEAVTVPAGTFDCFVISDEGITTTLISKTATHKIWVAKGVGTVKQETYDKKGNLEKLQLLTVFEK